MSAGDISLRVLEEIDETLALLTRNPILRPLNTSPQTAAPLPSLLAECERRLAAIAARPPVPLCMIHHLACTGGTLISKALAALPNTVLSSEIDPLSTVHLQAPKRPFFPTDIIADLRYSPRISGDAIPMHVFQAGLAVLLSELERSGLRLVLRDHAHSHFTHGEIDAERLTLHDMAAAVAPVLSVVTVRDPIASFVSLRRNRWVHFEPDTFDEYCRRYLAFLDAHASLPIFRYEDFVRDPVVELAEIAKALELPVAPDFESVMPLFALSGDSGRSGGAIAPRPPTEIPITLAAEAAKSTCYRTLCDRLGYTAASSED